MRDSYVEDLLGKIRLGALFQNEERDVIGWMWSFYSFVFSGPNWVVSKCN